MEENKMIEELLKEVMELKQEVKRTKELNYEILETVTVICSCLGDCFQDNKLVDELAIRTLAISVVKNQTILQKEYWNKEEKEEPETSKEELNKKICDTIDLLKLFL